MMGQPLVLRVRLKAVLSLTTNHGPLVDPVPLRSFTVAELRGEDVILGQPWLRSVNPLINWSDCSVVVRTDLSPPQGLLPYRPPSGRGKQAQLLIHALTELFVE